MANEKILIADDDKNICELLRLYLAKEGYETVIANDGEAAVAAFEKEKPNMAVSYTHLDVYKRQPLLCCSSTVPWKA